MSIAARCTALRTGSVSPVGEVEFVNGVAAMSASGGYGPARVCAGIVSHVDLLLGDGARPVLEAQIAAGNGRFRGIRHSSAWDAEFEVAGMYAKRPKGILLDPNFRKGFACLAPLDLSFDAWLFHPQIGELIDLARAFPDTRSCSTMRRPGRHRPSSPASARRLSHCGGHDPQIAKCPNVSVKLGGLAMRLLGYRFSRAPAAAVVRTGRGRVAALHRNLHRGVRPRPRDVRKQLSAR